MEGWNTGKLEEWKNGRFHHSVIPFLRPALRRYALEATDSDDMQRTDHDRLFVVRQRHNDLLADNSSIFGMFNSKDFTAAAMNLKRTERGVLQKLSYLFEHGHTLQPGPNACKPRKRLRDGPVASGALTLRRAIGSGPQILDRGDGQRVEGHDLTLMVHHRHGAWSDHDHLRMTDGIFATVRGAQRKRMETAARNALANSFQIHARSLSPPRYPVKRVNHRPLMTDHLPFPVSAFTHSPSPLDARHSTKICPSLIQSDRATDRAPKQKNKT